MDAERKYIIGHMSEEWKERLGFLPPGSFSNGAEAWAYFMTANMKYLFDGTFPLKPEAANE